MSLRFYRHFSNKVIRHLKTSNIQTYKEQWRGGWGIGCICASQTFICVKSTFMMLLFSQKMSALIPSFQIRAGSTAQSLSTPSHQLQFCLSIVSTWEIWVTTESFAKQGRLWSQTISSMTQKCSKEGDLWQILKRVQLNDRQESTGLPFSNDQGLKGDRSNKG